MPNNQFICDCHPFNQELVSKTINAMPDRNTLKILVDFFSMIGDNTRCKILFALEQTPLCVCDLANVLSMTKSSVSHQLKKLKAAGVVKCERYGKQVIYFLEDDHVLEIFRISIMHANHKLKEKFYEK